MLKAIIIDDEQRARNVLKLLIEQNIDGLEVLECLEDVPSGVKAIHKYRPDLVFLDVEMPGYNGFQLLDFFEEITFHIIFTTAYSEYALQAFQVSAIDYLLKPIQLDQLKKAVEKVQSQRGLLPSEQYAVLKSNVGEKGIQKLALPVSNGLIFVPLENIEYIEADGSYSQFVQKDGQKILVSKRLKEFEEVLLQSGKFFRPHRSYMVNLNCIKQYVKADGGYLIMQSNKEVSLSRDMKDEFLKAIGE